MRAHVMNGVDCVELVDISDPAGGDDQVVLYTDVVSVCSVDVSYFRGHRWPVVPGPGAGTAAVRGGMVTASPAAERRVGIGVLAVAAVTVALGAPLLRRWVTEAGRLEPPGEKPCSDPVAALPPPGTGERPGR